MVTLVGFSYHPMDTGTSGKGGNQKGMSEQSQPHGDHQQTLLACLEEGLVCWLLFPRKWEEDVDGIQE